MKITVDVDCTPEEARRFMGLPDLSSLHEAYLDKMKTMIIEGPTPEGFESMVKSWMPVVPMGEAGLGLWKQMLDQMTGAKKTG